MPAPPIPPENIVTEQDKQAQMLYEQWLTHQNNVLSQQLHYYETEVQKLRKSRKVRGKILKMIPNSNYLSLFFSHWIANRDNWESPVINSPKQTQLSCREFLLSKPFFRNIWKPAENKVDNMGCWYRYLLFYRHCSYCRQQHIRHNEILQVYSHKNRNV